MQLVECTYIYCNTFLAQNLTLKHGSVITICTASSEQHRQHRHAALQALQQLQRRLQWLTKLKTKRNPNSGSFFDLPLGLAGYIQASNKQDSKTNMLNHLQTLFLKKNLLLAANIWSKKSEGHIFLTLLHAFPPFICESKSSLPLTPSLSFPFHVGSSEPQTTTGWPDLVLWNHAGSSTTMSTRFRSSAQERSALPCQLCLTPIPLKPTETFAQAYKVILVPRWLR